MTRARSQVEEEEERGNDDDTVNSFSFSRWEFFDVSLLSALITIVFRRREHFHD